MADTYKEPLVRATGVRSPEELTQALKEAVQGNYYRSAGEQLYQGESVADAMLALTEFYRRSRNSEKYADTASKVADGIIDSFRGQEGGYSAPNNTTAKSPIGPSWTLPEQYAQFSGNSFNDCHGVLARAGQFYDKKNGKWILKAEPYQLREGETPGDVAARVPRVGDITFCERGR